MSAIYMSQLSTALPALMEGGHHQLDHHHQGHFQAFAVPKEPPLLFPFMIDDTSRTSDSSLSYGSPDRHLLMRQRQAMLETQHMIGGSAAATPSVFATTPFPTVESIRDDMMEPSSYDPYDMGRKLQADRSIEAGGNWTTLAAPAKMRITRKASADPGAGVAVKRPRRRAQQAYEDVSSQQPPNLGVIRVCSDCNTTKTPLWRSGPCGPKSLCNACGIRQRKARRAMMMVAAGAVSADNFSVKAGTATPGDAMAVHPKVKKEKRADVDRSLPFKKRCKAPVQDHSAVAAPPAAADKAGVQQATIAQVADDADNIGHISWSRPSPAPAAAAATACSSFRPSTPALPVQHDEITDAAMLLMTLSCGLVRS